MKKMIATFILFSTICTISLSSCDFILDANDREQSDSGSNSENGDNTEDGNDSENTQGGEDMIPEAPKATVLPVKGGAKGIVVLIHDDGYTGTVERFDSLLEKHGLVGNIALVTKFVYNTTTKTPKTSEVKKFQKFLDTGRWKIVSHSYTHEWWAEDGVENADRMYEEIVGSQTILRELFPGQRVLTFAYPGLSSAVAQYGSQTVFSEAAKNLIEDTYISGRKGMSTAPIDITNQYLKWNLLNGYGFMNGAVRNGTVQSIIENAAKNGGLALLYTHQLKADTETQEKADATTYNNNVMGIYYMDMVCEEVAKHVKNGDVWNTYYEDAILYIREAQTSQVSVSESEDLLRVLLTDEMDDEIYNYALTVRIAVPDSWGAVRISQGESVSYASVKEIKGKLYIDADIIPDAGEATISPITPSEYNEISK